MLAKCSNDIQMVRKQWGESETVVASIKLRLHRVKLLYDASSISHYPEDSILKCTIHGTDGIQSLGRLLRHFGLS